MLLHDQNQIIEIEKLDKKGGATQQLDSEEIGAIKQAQQEADERYTRLYNRNKKNTKRKKASWLTKTLAIVYLLALVLFAANITTLSVLPVKNLNVVIVGVSVISILIITELCRSNVRKWIRIFISIICIALTATYCIGSYYIIKTMDFLDTATEESGKKVESLAYEPFNVMITGIDVSGTIDEKGRSDVNMLVTVNPNTAQILITSIPRDYEIFMPDKGFEMDKLTHTGFYGVDTTIQAEEELLRTDINYYVKVNFSTVVKFIDAIGGIDVYSEYTFSARYTPWTFYEGMNHMSGEQALAFARERKSFETGDNQRVRNQQAVVEAVIKKATSSTAMILQYNELLSSLRDYFKMSISAAEIQDLIKMQISDSPKWKIYKNSLTGKGELRETYTSPGARLYVMLQDEESVENARTLIKGVLNGGLVSEESAGKLKVSFPDIEEENS